MSAPTFFGGTVPFKWLGKHRLGYSVLTRAKADDRFVVRTTRALDVIPDASGDENLASELLLANDMKETWVGLTWAFFNHLCSGLRHFVLDIGAGFELDTNRTWSIAANVLGVVLTIAFWAVVLAKQGVDLHANSFGQYLLEAFVRHGHFAKHIDRVRPAYRRRRDAMASALASIGAGMMRCVIPQKGYYI